MEQVHCDSVTDLKFDVIIARNIERRRVNLQHSGFGGNRAWDWCVR